MPTAVINQRELSLVLQDYLKRIRVLEANLGGGVGPGIDFNKTTTRTAQASPPATST